MTRSTPIPWLLILLGSGFLVLTAWSILIASQRSSGVTDPDYYSHGLRYNETMLEKRAAASLGWTTGIELTGHRLAIELRDREQQPVHRANGRLQLAGSGQLPAIEILLTEERPGRYLAILPETLRGERAAEINFIRDGARLSKRLLLSLP
ncbi:MAG: FixH family protein [Desulfuromonadales bacterium]|nr:FixH family protein [Desulfuromonadales bacterium]